VISLLEFEPTMAPEREIEKVEDSILLIRGQRVMLDSDLAKIYGTSTMRLNEQRRRNAARFPADFAFQLTNDDFANLISQNAISKRGGQIAQLFAAIRQLLAPRPAKKREIGFHVREKSAVYRTRKKV
jgi:hypothetical protein